MVNVIGRETKLIINVPREKTRLDMIEKVMSSMNVHSVSKKNC